MLSSAQEDVSLKLDVMCFAHKDTASRTLESFIVPRGAADKICVWDMFYALLIHVSEDYRSVQFCFVLSVKRESTVVAQITKVSAKQTEETEDKADPLFAYCCEAYVKFGFITS